MNERTFGNRVRVCGGAVFGFLLAWAFVYAEPPDKRPDPRAAKSEPQDVVAKSLTIVDTEGNPRIILYCDTQGVDRQKRPRNIASIVLQGPNGRYPCTQLTQDPRAGLLVMRNERGSREAKFGCVYHLGYCLTDFDTGPWKK